MTVFSSSQFIIVCCCLLSYSLVHCVINPPNRHPSLIQNQIVPCQGIKSVGDPSMEYLEHLSWRSLHTDERRIERYSNQVGSMRYYCRALGWPRKFVMYHHMIDWYFVGSLLIFSRQLKYSAALSKTPKCPVLQLFVLAYKIYGCI